MNNKIEFTVQGSKGRSYQTYFMLDENNKLDYSHCSCTSYRMKRKCKHIDSLLNNDKKIKILNGDISRLSLIKSESSELAHNEVILWENEITKIEEKLSEAKIEFPRSTFPKVECLSQQKMQNQQIKQHYYFHMPRCLTGMWKFYVMVI